MSRGARRTIIVIVVLLGLLVAADRISLVAAEGVAANSIKDSQRLESTPSVSAKGFPFLTQLISGNYDEIDVKARGLHVDPSGDPLRVDSVSVALHGVHVSHGFSVVNADTANASALIHYSDLSQTLGTTVTYVGNARVSASTSVTVAGVALRGSVSVRPELTASNTLTFADPQVSALGIAVPDALTRALTSIFGNSISLAALPFGLQFTAIEATSAGIVVHLHGSHVVYDSRTN